MGEYGWVVSFCMYGGMFVSAFIIKPVVLLLKALRWLVERYPKQVTTLVLAASAAIILHGIFTDQLNSKVFGPIFLAILVATAATIAWMVPLGNDDPLHD